MNIFERIEALQDVSIRDWLTKVVDIISTLGTCEHLYAFSNEDLRRLACTLQTSLERTGHAIYSTEGEVSIYGKAWRDANGLIHHTDVHLFISPFSDRACLEVLNYRHSPGEGAVEQKLFTAFFDKSRTLSSVSRGSPLNFN